MLQSRYTVTGSRWTTTPQTDRRGQRLTNQPSIFHEFKLHFPENASDILVYIYSKTYSAYYTERRRIPTAPAKSSPPNTSPSGKHSQPCSRSILVAKKNASCSSRAEALRIVHTYVSKRSRSRVDQARFCYYYLRERCLRSQHLSHLHKLPPQPRRSSIVTTTILPYCCIITPAHPSALCS